MRSSVLAAWSMLMKSLSPIRMRVGARIPRSFSGDQSSIRPTIAAARAIRLAKPSGLGAIRRYSASHSSPSAAVGILSAASCPSSAKSLRHVGVDASTSLPTRRG